MEPPIQDPLPLPARFAQIKQEIVFGREAALIASWTRLLQKLKAEIDIIASRGSSLIPSIAFADIWDESKVAEFSSEVHKHGVAIIREVVPANKAEDWRNEIGEFVSGNPSATSLPTRDPHLYSVYWTSAQVKARADSNVLATQRFLMSLWHSSDAAAQISTRFPVSYADRVRIRGFAASEFTRNPHVDGGSVERWEPDGYGRAATYGHIWEGRWEDYDSWESSTRLKVTSDLYYGTGACSMFRMFQGWLALSSLHPQEGTLQLCPMIQLSTAYLLLRPFFVPINPDRTNIGFLSPENWALEVPSSSVIHGAVPSYTQDLDQIIHPHLDLGRSMVNLPSVGPGDYIVWHPDAIYAVDQGLRQGAETTIMYLPACPLTQTNALYLARQRKAFLLGHPSPDFGGGRSENPHIGRPGVQEINETGGYDGLRAMGLMPWDDDEARTDTDADVIEMANDILFPDRHDMG